MRKRSWRKDAGQAAALHTEKQSRGAIADDASDAVRAEARQLLCVRLCASSSAACCVSTLRWLARPREARRQTCFPVRQIQIQWKSARSIQRSRSTRSGEQVDGPRVREDQRQIVRSDHRVPACAPSRSRPRSCAFCRFGGSYRHAAAQHGTQRDSNEACSKAWCRGSRENSQTSLSHNDARRKPDYLVCKRPKFTSTSSSYRFT